MRFAVATFQRVFDTEPNRDVLDLKTLVHGLTHFLVRPEAHARTLRERHRLETAEAAWNQGIYAPGKYWAGLSQAKKRAEAEGRDGDEAARREAQHRHNEIRAMAKKDLRLWSPTHYPAGSRRSGDNVLHLSCLVLDFDSGLAVDEALLPWENYFHIVHSTWSYTPERPKYRLVLPLAAPVAAPDWPAVYAWALERSGGQADASKKGAGTTFALPAVPDVDRPRVAFSRPGPLLDMVLEGLVEDAAPAVDEATLPHEPNHFRRPIPGHQIVGPPDATPPPSISTGAGDENDAKEAGLSRDDEPADDVPADDEDLWQNPFPWS